MQWTKLTVKKIDAFNPQEVYLNKEGEAVNIDYKEAPTVKSFYEESLKGSSEEDLDKMFKFYEETLKEASKDESFKDQIEDSINNLPERYKDKGEEILRGDFSYIRNTLKQMMQNDKDYYLDSNKSFIITFNEKPTSNEASIGNIRGEQNLFLMGARINVFEELGVIKGLLTTSDCSLIIKKDQYLVEAYI